MFDSSGRYIDTISDDLYDRSLFDFAFSGKNFAFAGINHLLLDRDVVDHIPREFDKPVQCCL